MQPPLEATRWSDDRFLDEVRSHGDLLADTTVRQLSAAGVRTADILRVFQAMPHNGSPIPPDTPAPLREYLEQTSRLPEGSDLARIDRGQAAFMTTCIPSILVLLLKSLPEGYAAPGLTKILNLSGQLRDNPFHRLMGTLQLLVDVSSPHGFESGEHETPGTMGPRRGIVTTQQVRLLHAGVRVNVAPKTPGYQEYLQAHGIPINLEDMLGTLIGFSLLVVDGLRSLRISMGSRRALEPDAPYSEDEEAYFYLWQVFGRLFGIYPPGHPESGEYIPGSLAEAEEFYASYRRRHYVGAMEFEPGWREQSRAENPDGFDLTHAHIEMMGVVLQHLFPRFMRPAIPLSALRLVPRIYSHHLIKNTGCARVGIEPVLFFGFLKQLLFDFPAAWARLWGGVDSGLHEWVSEKFLEHLVGIAYVKGVAFTVPSDLEDLKEMVEQGWRQA